MQGVKYFTLTVFTLWLTATAGPAGAQQNSPVRIAASDGAAWRLSSQIPFAGRQYTESGAYASCPDGQPIVIDHPTASNDNFVIHWELNRDYAFEDTFTLNWIAETFDSLLDVPNNTGYNYDNKMVTVDSFTLDFMHRNTSGRQDTIIVSLVTLGKQGHPREVRMWSDSVITNSSLAPDDPALRMFYPGFPLSYQQKFGIRVDYYGPLQDTFRVAATFWDDCSGDCFSRLPALSPSTYFYVNDGGLAGITGEQSNETISIDCSETGPPPNEEDCEYWYIQNLGLIVYASFQADVLIKPTVEHVSCAGCCDGNIKVEVEGGTPPYDYEWQQSGETTDEVSDLCAGNYELCVTDADTCTVCSVIPVYFPTNMEAASRTRHKLQAAPNPFRHYTVLELPEPLHNGQLVLYDRTGRQVHTLEGLYGQKVKLPRRDLPPGLYLYRLSHDTGAVFTGRIVIIE